MTNAVLYIVGVSTDGFAGYGLHGYTYELDVPKRGTGNAKITPTALGYAAKGALVPAVTPLNYIDSFESIAVQCPANAIALVGVTRAIQLALTNKVTKLTLLYGSKYVAKYMDDYISKGNPVNRAGHQNGGYGPEWTSVLESYLELLASGCEVINIGIDPTSQNPGIAKATISATMASYNAMKQIHTKSVVNKPPAGYWNPAPKINPLLDLKKLYFYTAEDANVPGLYFLGTSMMTDEYEGKRSNDTTYSIAMLKTPDPVLEALRNEHVRLSAGIDTMVMAMLPKVFRPAVYTNLQEYESAALKNESGYRQDLSHASGTLITREFRPAGLAIRAMEALQSLYSCMAEYQSGQSTRQTVTDVTSFLYDLEPYTSKTGHGEVAATLKPEFGVGVTSVKVDVAYNLKAAFGRTRLELIFGTDLPDRNPLKRLEADSPRIYVITDPSAENSFQFFTIIETSTGDKSIWIAPFTSYRIIPLPVAT